MLEWNLNKYLDYIRTGGRLVIKDSDNNSNRTFSRLFSTNLNESIIESFSSISGNNNQNVSISVPRLVK
jgi:hypothetical protein